MACRIFFNVNKKVQLNGPHNQGDISQFRYSQEGGLSSSIRSAFDKLKSEVAARKVPGNISENVNLVW